MKAQATDFAATSRPIQAVRSVDTCEEKLTVALQRLDKALDAYEKANNALNSALSEIEARKTLDNLKNEWLAVKDQIIKAQAELITFYQKQRVKGKWQKFFERVEKILLVGGSLWLGSKL